MFRKYSAKIFNFTQDLRFKLSFYTGLVAFLSIVVFALYSINNQESSLVNTRIQGALKDSDVVKAAVWNGMMTKDRQVIRDIVDAIGQLEGVDRINIYDQEGILHYSSDPDGKAQIGKLYSSIDGSRLLTNLGENKKVRYDFTKGSNEVTVVNPMVNTPSCSTAECHAHPESQPVLGALELKLKLTGLRSQVRKDAQTVVYFAAFLFLLISSIIGLAVIFFVSRPVDKLRAKAQRIARGDYKTKPLSLGTDSIGQLSSALDEMSRQINQREREVDQRRKMYQELFEQVPCYIAVISPDYKIVRANRSFITAFGEKTYKNCFSAFKERDSKCLNCPVEKTFEDGLNHRVDEIWNLKNSDEKAHVIVTTTPIFDDLGKITEVMEMAVDVTRLMKLQEEIKKKEAQFKALFENVPCYLTVIDRSYRIGFYNKMFSKDFGAKWGESCYKAYKGRTEKCQICPVEKTFEDGESHFSEEIWRRNGEERHIVVRTAPILDDSGSITAVMEMCTNVTELRLLENRLAILGETIAGTSHAIKNILSGLEGGVYVVDSGLRSSDADKIRMGWSIVKKNVSLVSDLVKDILYASKERTPELKLVDPGQVLNDIAELFEGKARKDGISLIKAFEPNLGRGLLDPAGLHTVVSNLISNAMAACSERTLIDHHIILSAELEDEVIIIDVSDNGKGMSDDVKANLFKKFFSTKGAKGTGLGLLVTRKIVEENGGSIICESTLGRGTKFIVRLPFTRTEEALLEKEASAAVM